MGKTGRPAVVAAAWLSLGVAVLAPTARAGSPACNDAYVAAQRMRKDGKLIEARQQLTTCSSSECPSFIRSDCARWIGELEPAIPTVVFIAKDENGRDLIDGVVYVDDQQVAAAIDGRPIPVDPGAHSVRFVFGGRSTEQRLVIAIGEKNRRIEADFAATAPPVKEKPSHLETSTAKVATMIVLGVASLGLLGGGIGLAVASGSANGTAATDRAALQNGGSSTSVCFGVTTGTCGDLSSQVSARATDSNVSTGFFVGAGAVAVALGATYLVWPRSRVVEGARIVPVMTPSLAGLGLSGSF